MIIDQLLFDLLAVGDLVGHQRVAGEPSLVERIAECARRDPRPARRPEPQSSVGIKAPVVAAIFVVVLEGTQESASSYLR